MARKLGDGALRNMLDRGKRELGEATIAFPGQTPVAQPYAPALRDRDEERLESRINALEARAAERAPEIEMERE